VIKIKPKYMSYALTWRCNSKCKVCNTWKINDHKNELTLEEIKNIFKDNFFNNIKETVLTGGEPFLRYDITDIAKIIHNKTGSSIGVTTNALLSEKVFVFVKNMLKNNIPIGVYISLDGPEKIHDELRGVSGNFKRIIKLLRRLVSIEDKNLTVSAGMTVSKDNINYINETDNICKEIGCELSIRLNEYAGYFHNRKTNLNFSNLQKKKIIKSLLFLERNSILFFNSISNKLSSCFISCCSFIVFSIDSISCFFCFSPYSITLIFGTTSLIFWSRTFIF